MTSAVRTATDWMFRDRATGKYVVAQRPNAPLAVWLACLVVEWLAHPGGAWGTALRVLSAIALIVWAGDEVVRGVNPWRRLLGATVLIGVGVGYLLRR